MRIRSDVLRQVIRAAVAQGFVNDETSRHPALVCPVCGHREIYTQSGRQVNHEIRGKISRLRKHGLMFKGLGGKHA